jgi:hypothetical protein
MTVYITELLSDGNNAVTVDGDVIPFDPELDYDVASGAQGDELRNERTLEVEGLATIVGLLNRAARLKELAERGSGDRQVRTNGGVKKCVETADANKAEARKLFFALYNYPPSEQAAAESDELEAWYEGVQRWHFFRTQLNSSEARAGFLAQLNS